MLDLIVKNGSILDGSGSPPYQADIAVRKGKIHLIEPGIGLDSQEIIDAQGLCVSPGFIDMHTHTDFTILGYPRADSMLRQGVTTQVVGNCGLSPAPVTEDYQEVLRTNSTEFDLYFAKHGFQWAWPSMQVFLEQVAQNGTALNLVPLTGHRTLRIAAMGFAKRPPGPQEMQRMKTLLQADLEAGIFGLSSGLFYDPASFAGAAEMEELLSIVSGYNGLYATHIRCEGNTLLESLTEAIDAARSTGVSLEISHLKAEGKSNWGKAGEALAAIEQARSTGLDITFDQYPYTAFNCGLIEVFPQWAKEAGSGELLRQLADPSRRAQIAASMDAISQTPEANADWRDIGIIGFRLEQNKAFEGLRIDEIAQRMGRPPEEAVIELFSAEAGALKMIGYGMCEEDIATIMQHPLGMVGSDGFALEDGASESVHPRSFGTFPRILGRYVREQNLLSLPEAIRKMTSMPAAKLKLRDRGRLQAGFKADITVFDPEKVIDRATFAQAKQFPAGVEAVIVNGGIAYANQRFGKQLFGRILRRS